MMQAYVGIVSRQGLELFCPEHPQTVRFLWRRLRRRRGAAICVWSVIAEEEARLIELALADGRSREALVLLQLHARDCGVLAPLEEDAPPALAC